MQLRLNCASAWASPSSQARFPTTLLRELASAIKINNQSTIDFGERFLAAKLRGESIDMEQ